MDRTCPILKHVSQFGSDWSKLIVGSFGLGSFGPVKKVRGPNWPNTLHFDPSGPELTETVPSLIYNQIYDESEPHFRTSELDNRSITTIIEQHLSQNIIPSW